MNKISALSYVSESELELVFENYYKGIEEKDTEGFYQMLWTFGLDYNLGYCKQENIHHRNKMNKVVTCSRWVGNERTDNEWIGSGLASREVLDKVSGCKILEDVYRRKCLTEDVQQALETKDAYNKKFDRFEEDI